MIRRLALVLAAGVTAVWLGASQAGAASAAAAPIGPECAPNVVAAVLAAVQGRVTPGQIVQYLQVTADGRLQLCTVTVPSEGV